MAIEGPQRQQRRHRQEGYDRAFRASGRVKIGMGRTKVQGNIVGPRVHHRRTTREDHRRGLRAGSGIDTHGVEVGRRLGPGSCWLSPQRIDLMAARGQAGASPGGLGQRRQRRHDRYCCRPGAARSPLAFACASHPGCSCPPIPRQPSPSAMPRRGTLVGQLPVHAPTIHDSDSRGPTSRVKTAPRSTLCGSGNVEDVPSSPASARVAPR